MREFIVRWKGEEVGRVWGVDNALELAQTHASTKKTVPNPQRMYGHSGNVKSGQIYAPAYLCGYSIEHVVTVQDVDGDNADHLYVAKTKLYPSHNTWTSPPYSTFKECVAAIKAKAGDLGRYTKSIRGNEEECKKKLKEGNMYTRSTLSLFWIESGGKVSKPN